MTQRQTRGFTLVELTIVLVIIALLTSGMIISFSTQKDITDATETQKQLAAINDALLGFAATYQRLPCPASTTSGGLEAFCSDGNPLNACGAELTAPQAHGRCRVPLNGFLPAASLGVSPTDTNGFAVDRWNNRIRYAVTQNPAGTVNYPFTASSTSITGIKAAWSTSPPALAPDLRVCGQTACSSVLTDAAAALVFSTGKNGSVPAANPDELENTDGDTTFVSRTQTASYDDIIAWLSPNLLYNRLIAAGRLP